MAYDHQKSDVLAGSNISVATTGVKTNTPAGTFPFVVRAFAAVIRTVPTVTATIVTGKRRPTPGSATGEVIIGTLVLPTTAALGNLYYKTGFSTKVFAGEEFVFDVTTASTAGAADLIVQTEPNWDIPGNSPKMILSA